MIYDHLISEYPDATVSHNVHLQGQLSETQRQIDILISERLPGDQVLTAIEAKCHNRPIDVKGVEEFLGLLRDVNVGRGIMVSNQGYTGAAFTRAVKDEVDLDLDIFSLDEFIRWQATGAIPYAGRNAISLPAPFGWGVDGERVPGILARLYRRGLSFQEAANEMEFMYVNLWDRRGPVNSLATLLAEQAEDIKRHSPDAVISVIQTGIRNDHESCIRRAEIAEYPTAEITGFVEFPNSIFFAVMFTPLVVERRNLRKLGYLLKKVLPTNIRHAA